MRYNFSKKQVIKNSLTAFLYAFILSTFLIAVVSNLYNNFWIEILAAFSISVSVAIVFSMVNYIFYLRKTFEIDENGIIFYVKDKVVKTIEFSSVIETDISKSMIYGNNRVIALTTEKETIRFSINYKVYQRIRHFFPIFNDRKDESLIRLTPKYKLKTLLMQYSIIVFYFSVAFMILAPMVVNLLKKYSAFYYESTRLFYLLCIGIFALLILGYTLYFFYKFFTYSRHSLRFDGTLKLEYYRFNKQKRNNEIKNIIGIKHVKSIFSSLFNLEQIYIIWKNERDIVQNDFVPFCLTSQDVKKLKSAIFNEEEKLEKIPKKVGLHSIFTLVVFTFAIIVLSLLFSPWCLMTSLIVLPCIVANFKTRGSFVGEGIIPLSNGVLTKRIYTFKIPEIQGVTVTDRFFETKSEYATYEIYIEGYSGVYVMGVYKRDLEQKIIKKIKNN